MALLWLAWILVIVGIIAVVALVVYTEFGRDPSIPLSILLIIIASVALGFSIHLFLI
ncbi:MAG: hypothetical protein GF364_12350 [Candidatus Lokiarchaeota archaeon]|nr:hypothetical protein [Candidatus Lokiarchaeota archaeon]